MRLITSTIAWIMLGFMFILMFFSAWNDSATMDELAHIPAGYSYLTQKDYRLNPEHPPLIKDLAAFPMLYLNLNFPTDVKAWKDDINGQWDMGSIFLYKSGNDANKILHFSRFPIMLLAILFGWLLYKWVRGIYGYRTALVTLFFYATSPTFIAHSRYVTTDLGAAFGFFIGIAAFVNFLFKYKTNSENKNLIIAGVAFGIAQLLKFSLFLLAPIYIILGILWIILDNFREKNKIISESLKMVWKIFLIGLIGLFVIIIVYQFHVWNYPVERQLNDAKSILESYPTRILANVTIWLSDKPILRGLGQYLLGLLMVLRRAAGGNTTYFLGEVSNLGWPSYFPLLYLFKEYLAFHIFTLIAIIFSIRNIIKTKEKNLLAVVDWLKENFALTASMIFIAIYWLQAITSPLNIGVRHVLPTFPFIYLLVSRQIVRWSNVPTINNPRTFFEILKDAYEACIKSLKRHLIIGLLFMWIIISLIIAFPFYLSYFNELVGGTFNGYKIATDSNYDWGQDLKRLSEFVNDNHIEKIYVDYFGGGNPEYYLENKFEQWRSSYGKLPEGSWFAISAGFLQECLATPVKGFSKNPEDAYSWLKEKKSDTRAGTSIFIYKF